MYVLSCTKASVKAPITPYLQKSWCTEENICLVIQWYGFFSSSVYLMYVCMRTCSKIYKTKDLLLYVPTNVKHICMYTFVLYINVPGSCIILFACEVSATTQNILLPSDIGERQSGCTPLFIPEEFTIWLCEILMYDNKVV